MARGRNRQLERSEQEAFVRWTSLQMVHHRMDDGRVVHVCLRELTEASVNGAFLQGDGTKRQIQWKQLERAGAKSGAPDLTIFYPVKPYAGLRIEMKKRREDFRSPSDIHRAVSDGQDEVIGLMRRVGYRAVVAYGWQEAAIATCEYLGWDAKAMGLTR